MATDQPVKTYATERAALARVEQLQRLGYWPGIRRRGDRFVLTVDPDTAGSKYRASEGRSG